VSAPSVAALAPGKLAVGTGAASDSEPAAARTFADAGMQVVLVDRPGDPL